MHSFENPGPPLLLFFAFSALCIPVFVRGSQVFLHYATSHWPQTDYNSVLSWHCKTPLVTKPRPSVTGKAKATHTHTQTEAAAVAYAADYSEGGRQNMLVQLKQRVNLTGLTRWRRRPSLPPKLQWASQHDPQGPTLLTISLSNFHPPPLPCFCVKFRLFLPFCIKCFILLYVFLSSWKQSQVFENSQFCKEIQRTENFRRIF